MLPNLNAVFQHIDYIVNLVGEEHAAIGSDFDGIPYSCTGLEHIGKLEALVDMMHQRGYSEDRIGKIMGGNAVRVMKHVLR